MHHRISAEGRPWRKYICILYCIIVAVRKPIDVDGRAEQMSDGVSNIVDTVGCEVDEKSPKEKEQIGGSLQKVISCREEIIRTEPSNKRTENAACARRKTCCIA